MKKLQRNKFSFQFETFRDLEEALELIFSSSAASVILFTAAVRCGTQCFKRVIKGVKKRQDALYYFSKLKQEENWGKISFSEVNFAKGTGKIIVTDSFETIAIKSHTTKKNRQPCCHFLRGFLAGFLSELFQKTIRVTEKKCVGKGDGHCEFTFKPSEEKIIDFNDVHQ